MKTPERIRHLLDTASSETATAACILASSASANDFQQAVSCANSSETAVDTLGDHLPSPGAVDLAILRNRSLHGHLLTLRHTIEGAIDRNDQAIAALRELSEAITEKADEADEL